MKQIDCRASNPTQCIPSAPWSKVRTIRVQTCSGRRPLQSPDNAGCCPILWRIAAVGRGGWQASRTDHVQGFGPLLYAYVIVPVEVGIEFAVSNLETHFRISHEVAILFAVVGDRKFTDLATRRSDHTKHSRRPRGFGGCRFRDCRATGRSRCNPDTATGAERHTDDRDGSCYRALQS